MITHEAIPELWTDANEWRALDAEFRAIVAPLSGTTAPFGCRASRVLAANTPEKARAREAKMAQERERARAAQKPAPAARMASHQSGGDLGSGEFLGPSPRPSGAGAQHPAEQWLRGELSGAGWVASAEVRSRARAAGFSDRQVQRAARVLGVRVERRGFPARSYWTLNTERVDDERG